MQMSDMKSAAYSPAWVVDVNIGTSLLCADACSLYPKVRFRFSDYTYAWKPSGSTV